MEGEDAQALSSTDSLGVFSTITRSAPGYGVFTVCRAALRANHLFFLGNRLGSQCWMLQARDRVPSDALRAESPEHRAVGVA